MKQWFNKPWLDYGPYVLGAALIFTVLFLLMGCNRTSEETTLRSESGKVEIRVLFHGTVDSRLLRISEITIEDMRYVVLADSQGLVVLDKAVIFKPLAVETAEKP